MFKPQKRKKRKIYSSRKPKINKFVKSDWQYFKDTVYWIEKTFFFLVYNNVYKPLDKYLDNNIFYLIIKDIWLWISTKYIQYNLFKIIFWGTIILYYNGFRIHLDPDSIFNYLKYLLAYGIFSYKIFFILMNYYKDFYINAILFQFVTLFEIEYLIEYLIWCLFYHPYLYTILFGINIGFITSHFIFIKWYKIPYKYKDQWALKMSNYLNKKKNTELFYEKYANYWQEKWFESTSQYWYNYYNYLKLKKDYKTLNKKLIESELRVVKLKREIVKRDFFE